MEIFNNLTKLNNISLALGFFDGVHIGHQAVINSAVQQAKKYNTKSAVITFKKNPAEMFSQECVSYISTTTKRQELIKKLGIDYLFELDFTEELANITGEKYIENILVEYFNPIAISFNLDTFSLESASRLLFIAVAVIIAEFFLKN